MTTHEIDGWTIRVWPSRQGMTAVCVPWRFEFWNDSDEQPHLEASSLALSDFPNVFICDQLHGAEMREIWEDFVLGRDRLFRYSGDDYEFHTIPVYGHVEDADGLAQILAEFVQQQEEASLQPGIAASSPRKMA